MQQLGNGQMIRSEPSIFFDEEHDIKLTTKHLTNTFYWNHING
jgi:hypothetical protein